jgi:hypothetical protein
MQEREQFWSMGEILVPARDGKWTPPDPTRKTKENSSSYFLNEKTAGFGLGAMLGAMLRALKRVCGLVRFSSVVVEER